MIIPRALLSRPVIKADPTLRQLLDSYAQEMLDKLPKAERELLLARFFEERGISGEGAGGQ